MTEEKPWTRPVEAVIGELKTDPDDGLTSREAQQRIQRYGPNALQRAAPTPWYSILARQFKSVVVLLLVAAGVVSLFLGDFWETIAIATVVLVNAAIGFRMELSAARSMEALRKMGTVKATVVRDGSMKMIDAQELVPGDIVIIEAGNVISADLRIVESARLQANESALTGESVPVGKSTDPVGESQHLADRKCMLYKGTSVTRGFGRAVVTATGLQTELGQISELIASVESQETPLEKRLDKLAGKLVWASVGIAALVALISWILGRELAVVVETAIALAIATIPEGLPIVATIALARGMRRMAKRNALVKGLGAVETLGATSVICTDKTGTLTHNHLTVRTLWTPSAKVSLDTVESGRVELSQDQTPDTLPPDVSEALRIGALCNHAELDEGGIGDPLEIALLEAAIAGGHNPDELDKALPIEKEEAFDPATRMMATWHPGDDGQFLVAVKGAPEDVIAASNRFFRSDETLDEQWRKTWTERNEELAAGGLRVLAVACKESSLSDDPYQDLAFVGLIGMVDPPRTDVADAVAACRSAGVDVVMLTGDQPTTARYIGHQTGIVDVPDANVISGGRIHEMLESADGRQTLLDTHLFARVSPAEKLGIIQLYQDESRIVAMTGDGVNDAPALRKADIGVAMGERGTDVAREAADIVLQDDAFSTIVAAVEQGRVIFQNIRSFVVYLMSCNFSELLVVSSASVIFPHSPLPITPLQILYLNLVTDVFPALALGLNKGRSGVMSDPPRPSSEPVLGRPQWISIGIFGTLMTITVLAVFAIAIKAMALPAQQAITIAFSALALAQVFHVFNMRPPGSNPFVNEVTGNRYVWGAVTLCLLLVIGPIYIPGINDVLSLTAIGPEGWALVAAGSLFPLFAGLLILARGRRSRPSTS